MNHLIHFVFPIALVIFSGIFYLLIEKIVEWSRYKDNRRAALDRELAAKEVGRSLVQLSCWYGEDRSVSEAIRLIGQEIMESGSVGTFNVSKTRDEWRKATGRPIQ